MMTSEEWHTMDRPYRLHPDSNDYDGVARSIYRVDGDYSFPSNYSGWRSPLFMPRWASRITLQIDEVRVERLQDITYEDCKAEGITDAMAHLAVMEISRRQWPDAYAAAFADRWDTINARRGYPWDANLWVWVLQFHRVTGG